MCDTMRAMRPILLALVLLGAAAPDEAEVELRPRTVTQRRHNTRRNPSAANRQFRDMTIYENESRRTHVKLIANYISNFQRDRSGELPPGIPTVAREICRSQATDCGALYNLFQHVRPHTASLPVDPQSPLGSKGTGYFIRRDWRDRFYITSPHGGPNIREQR